MPQICKIFSLDIHYQTVNNVLKLTHMLHIDLLPCNRSDRHTHLSDHVLMNVLIHVQISLHLVSDWRVFNHMFITTQTQCFVSMLYKLCSLWWKWELQQQLTKFIFSHGGRRTAVPYQSYNMILQVQALQPIRLIDLLITWGITNKYQDWFYTNRTIKGSARSSPQFFFKLHENKELPQDKMTQAVQLCIQKLQRKLRGKFCIHIITADSSLTIKILRSLRG